MLSNDTDAISQLDTLVQAQDFEPAIRPLAPLTQRLILDPQLKAAWTLARANP